LRSPKGPHHVAVLKVPSYPCGIHTHTMPANDTHNGQSLNSTHNMATLPSNISVKS
jgi:hypothetical protein